MCKMENEAMEGRTGVARVVHLYIRLSTLCSTVTENIKVGLGLSWLEMCVLYRVVTICRDRNCECR